MTPSIAENLHETPNISDKDSNSSFSLSDEEINNHPQFLEESKNIKEISKMNLDRANSMKEVRAQLKYSLQQRKQIFNSESRPKRLPESMYGENDFKNGGPMMSRKHSSKSRHSLSRVEYKHFKKHEFFEEKIKLQREMVRTLIEDDPESDRKVYFQNNQSFIKVNLNSLQLKYLNCLKSISKFLYGRKLIYLKKTQKAIYL